MPLFTTENAAEMGKRGAIARWTEPERPAFEPSLAVPNPQEAELARTREIMQTVHERLRKADYRFASSTARLDGTVLEFWVKDGRVIILHDYKNDG